MTIESQHKMTTTVIEDLTDGDRPLSIEEAVPSLQLALQASLGSDGFLSDVVGCSASDLAHPEAISPWKTFDAQLYRSESATKALRSLLRCKAPGTGSTFEDILSKIASSSHTKTHNHCFLIGGQVRDVLRGKLSTDIDFNYSSAAKDVALVAVGQEWPTKYKCIGDGVVTPNYVLIGDESNDCYLEGFSLDFNATRPCYTNDLTMNALLYDLTNDVIVDKTGRGVADVRAHSMRLSLSEGETFKAWSGACITPGKYLLTYALHTYLLTYVVGLLMTYLLTCLLTWSTYDLLTYLLTYVVWRLHHARGIGASVSQVLTYLLTYLLTHSLTYLQGERSFGISSSGSARRRWASPTLMTPQSAPSWSSRCEGRCARMRTRSAASG
jgi:hypothetical protein